jgi:hypothetical protein
MKTALLAALATVPACAHARALSVYAVLPPPEYDRPYEGKLIITRADAKELTALCPKHAIACVHHLAADTCWARH